MRQELGKAFALDGRAMRYLASDASRFVTGQVLRPNGGASMPG